MDKYQISDKVTLFQGDCMEVMRQYEDNYFDLAIVDPDFGLDEKISKGGTWAAKYKGFDGSLGGSLQRNILTNYLGLVKTK